MPPTHHNLVFRQRHDAPASASDAEKNTAMVIDTSTSIESLQNVVAATTIPADAPPAGVDLVHQTTYAPLPYWVGRCRFDIEWVQAQINNYEEKRDAETQALQAENKVLRAKIETLRAESKLAQERSESAQRLSKITEERMKVSTEQSTVEIEWLKMQLALQAEQITTLANQVNEFTKAKEPKDKKRSRNAEWRARKKARTGNEGANGNDADIKMGGDVGAQDDEDCMEE